MIKKSLQLILFILLFALLIAGYLTKDKLNNYIGNMMQTQVGTYTTNALERKIDSVYNYSKNGSGFEITFLEFGANCPACKRMEAVMADIRKKYPEKVNVVFFNILKPENQKLMKYYGIAAIPTQVLLDNNGIEFFRHTGFIATEELQSRMKLNSFSANSN
ncbi:MAG: hypothetical protein CVT92_10930 [Bacteroidetes bacterium HGW-Bacteroidetes-1]|jgi:thioredoxin 1|nr:MAG: hypothetical protein CVT92_10930 [Bacteroidetes bacterium HGW-Bacteroidetes-1]